MQTRRRELFTTVRTEGALLPPDLLRRIADGDRELEGLTPEAYHLATNERLGEAVTRSWNRLVGAWAGFRDSLARLPETDLATSVTRERWLLILFQELGYGRLPTARAVELDGKSYPVSHAWESVPIHLVGARVTLDRPTAGVAGAARQSPHGLLQELLNRDDAQLWGFVSNGLVLRVLRDNSSLTRQAYVEFDLEAMMEGEVYSDFVVLWLLCHQSRVEGERPDQCWLERWSQLATERGTRALESLRAGVEEAIKALGQGFLAHPVNRLLRDALRSGELGRDEYYRQLLRLVYRLLFLFVAEDRELLLAPDAAHEARDRYARFFSTQRLRRLAGRRRGGKHGDLFEGLRLVMRKLGEDNGCPDLGLPALGSFLWSSESTRALDRAQLANQHLLTAVRALALIDERGVRRAVDYKNLGSEELGSVYESLLELNPELNVDAPSFELRATAGHERKTTGSYYTPGSLIAVLLDSALDPVLDEATRADDPEEAILALTVCDPACGSGHFLVAAAHRIAKRLASIRTGDEEPAPEATRRALRDVVGRCLYGVDLNPMAVELCKVALWMEAIDPGRPLSFLDSHIKCGNSLFGSTPELISEGLPDTAFAVLEGDERDAVSESRRRNRMERSGQLTLEDEIAELSSSLVAATAAVEAGPDDSIELIHAKEERFSELISSTGYAQVKLLADFWCAAFVLPKRPNAPEVTHAALRNAARGRDIDDSLRGAVEAARGEYRFFHWHVEFPHVFDGQARRFDCILGNPPWDQVQFREQEFFETRAPSIAAASTGAQRKRMITKLKLDDPALWASFLAARRHVDAQRHFLQSSGSFPLTGRGRMNLYGAFSELMYNLGGARGRIGCVVPTGIATDDSTRLFFQDVTAGGRLISLLDFENHQRLFPDVDSRARFALLTLLSARNRARVDAGTLMFFLRSPQDRQDNDRTIVLGQRDFQRLNPNTLTCPVFRSRRDFEITLGVYERLPVLLNETEAEGNTWDISTKPGLFNMTGDSALFRDANALEGDGWRLDGNVFRRDDAAFVPLYEGKMFDFYDHRAADVVISATAQLRQGQPEPLTVTDHESPTRLPRPRHWVPQEEVERRLAGQWSQEWLVGWKEVTSPTNERTLIPGIFPRVGIGHKIPLIIVGDHAARAHLLVACMSSLVVDYICRQKLGSTSLTPFTVKQLPVVPPAAYGEKVPWGTETLEEWLNPRVLELAYTAVDLNALGVHLGWDGPPFRWNLGRRQAIRAEIDAAFLLLYGLTREQAGHVLDSFPITERRDVALHGEYKTKALVLECYDALSRAIETGEPYETRLTPHPADASVAHAREVTQRSEAEVLQFPFRRIAVRRSADVDEHLAPIYTLHAAAGSFGGGEPVEPDGWAELNGRRSIQPGMFVAQVRGKSMEPRIPNGAWCLFSAPVEGGRDGRILLVEHRAIDDPENGGSYTVKRYRSRKRQVEGELWEHEEIVLEPLNPEYEPIVLRDVEHGAFRVIAELVDVLG